MEDGDNIQLQLGKKPCGKTRL